MMEAKRDAALRAVKKESGLVDAEERSGAARSDHVAAIRALVRHPSRDPEIIAHKIRLLIQHFDDESGDLGPLLTSITGETEA